MDASTRKDYLTLQSWIGESTVGLGELLREHGTPRAALRAPAHCLETLPPRTRTALNNARRHWPRRNPAARDCLTDHGSFLPLDDAGYPPRLREIPDPPPWLFCRGDPHCLVRPAVAIVGSRRASRGGLAAAGEIAGRLAAAGYTVCSGLALGIDAAAHRGALRRGATTAVLASGLDRPSPRQNYRLAQEIVQRGCLVSELPVGTAPNKHRFPRRNRIISGLASATIIVEAALPSGSLHTAAAALEQGRDVMVLPWSLYHPEGAGCLRLLRDGATPITSLEELGDYFPGLEESPKGPRAAPGGDRGRLLSLLGDGGLSTDDLQASLDMDLGALLVLLGEMELDGWIHREDGAYRRSPTGSL